ncbi:MAG TPA: response regulator [Terracidiphilus sp.]|jgi:CheY-like chemotaxis protein
MNSLKPIWLVEDNVDDIELTLTALEGIPLANPVIVMRDGSEVSDRLQADREVAALPAVILLDIKMPKVSGIEVLRKIKGDPYLKRLPVVMLTSSRQGPDVAECYMLGANAYVVKPVESAAFFEAVKTVGRFWAIVNEQLEADRTGEGGNAYLAKR